MRNIFLFFLLYIFVGFCEPGKCISDREPDGMLADFGSGVEEEAPNVVAVPGAPGGPKELPLSEAPLFPFEARVILFARETDNCLQRWW